MESLLAVATELVFGFVQFTAGTETVGKFVAVVGLGMELATGTVISELPGTGAVKS